ncbi:MAG: glycosyltransferase family 4 protein, partial [Patescibacteria group bacterium]
MKILYITNSRIPTEKAYGIQIMKMCEAFSLQNIDLELILPTRKNMPFKGVDLFEYYSVEKEFKIQKIKSWDPDFLMKLPNGVYIKFQIIFFIHNLKKYFKNNIKDRSLIMYTRDEYLLPILQKFSNKVIWEAHSIPRNIKRYLKYWKNCHKIIVVNNKLKSELEKLGIAGNKILVAHDGVDLEKFNIETSKYELRKKFGLPEDKKIIMYTGHLYNWKGVQTLAEASNFLKDDQLIVFLGGTDYDIKNFKNKNADLIEQNKILVLGYKEPKLIPEYLKLADILVLPNTGKDKKSDWTSPMKLFEYMASGISILASDLPSIKEVLNQKNAIFFKSDNSQDLAEKIDYILNNSEVMTNLSNQAKQDVREYAWGKRVEKIIKF